MLKVIFLISLAKLTWCQLYNDKSFEKISAQPEGVSHRNARFLFGHKYGKKCYNNNTKVDCKSLHNIILENKKVENSNQQKINIEKLNLVKINQGKQI